MWQKLTVSGSLNKKPEIVPHIDGGTRYKVLHPDSSESLSFHQGWVAGTVYYGDLKGLDSYISSKKRLSSLKIIFWPSNNQKS